MRLIIRTPLGEWFACGQFCGQGKGLFVQTEQDSVHMYNVFLHGFAGLRGAASLDSLQDAPVGQEGEVGELWRLEMRVPAGGENLHESRTQAQQRLIGGAVSQRG